MKEVFDLLKFAPSQITNLLDVGIGKGQISRYFSKKNVKVTGIGLELESYGADLEQFRKEGIEVIECSVEDIPFEGETFDAVVASHILEHVPNMGVALQEMRRVLKEDGWLLIFLPRFSEYVCAGHINTGWNLGQLIYVLLINRFDVKRGHFIEYGSNLCAYVQKREFELPALRGDRGDIYLLNENNLWPFRIKEKNGDKDGFDGGVSCVRWKGGRDLIKKYDPDKKDWKKRWVRRGVRLIRKMIGVPRCREIGRRMMESEIYNPKDL